MHKGKYLIILLLLLNFVEGITQEISVRPISKNDTIVYIEVTEDSEPKSMSCEENNKAFYWLKYNSKIVLDEYKKDTIKTKKEDWEKEDEDAFDEEYNKEKKEELEAIEDEFNEDDTDINSLTEEELERFIEINWNNYKYNICKSDCESSLQHCYIYYGINRLQDYKKTYKYRTFYSWLEIKEDGDNEVEIEFDLVIESEVKIYFYVTCSCDDIPDLVSVIPSKLLSDSNPWSHIDLLGERMKPGYPFAVKKPFPILPLIGAAAGTGGLLYILTKEDVVEAPCPNIVGSSTINTFCGDQTGSAGINVDPPGDYTYAWSSGQNTPSISSLTAGAYTVTVTQAGTECITSRTITVPDNTSALSDTEVITINTDCGASNGSATINNPMSDVTYSWSNGQFGNMATDLASGNYSVSISKGTCLDVVDFMISENQSTIMITGEVMHPTCGILDGSISFTDSPQYNYSYQWSTGSSTSSISSLGQGSYEVTITDNETNCTKTENFNLEDLPADLTLTFSPIDATCGISDGSISVEVDPSGTYSFLWSNGETTQTISDQKAGEYSVTVSLVDTECSVTGNSKINEKPFPLEIEYLLNHPNCGLSDGEIELQLTPTGNFTFDWSNGLTTQNISNLSNGEYSVTITDQNGCTAFGQTQLEDIPTSYIDNIESSPGDCITVGEITISLNTPGDGPIVTIINGPNAQETLFLEKGTFDLSTLTDIPPGSYSIEVYDQNAGPECSQTVDIIVEDNTPNPSAVDDSYETGSGETVSGNVLDNDLGLNIFVNSFYGAIGGTTVVESTGEFQFTPDDDFEGEASFKYVIEDACQGLDTATVLILIKQTECNFIPQFDIEAASCGLEDGNVFATVEPDGNYSYQWSDGGTEAQLENIGGGLYGLTITDNDLGCFLTFEVTIPENEPSYVSNIIVTQPSCSVPAEIQFGLTSSTAGPFLATISHPNGIDAFVIPGGVVFLSDYIAIVTGTYTISLYDTNAGPACSETFSVFVEEPTELTIALLEIIPPSSPTANDGAVVIEVTSPGIPPYDIWVNGDVWDQTLEIEFIISGFSVGEYSIFITDAVGCTSNVIGLFIPPPMISPLTIGVGLISQIQSLQETPQFRNINEPLYFVELSGDYNYFGINTTTTLRVISPNQNSTIALSHLLEIVPFNLGKVNCSLKGGIVFTHELGEFKEPAFMSEFSGTINLKGPVNLEVFMSKSNESGLPLNVGFKFRY